LLVGPHAGDIRLRARFHWRGDLTPPEPAAPPGELHTGLPLKVLLADVHGRRVLERHLGELLQHPQADMAMEMSLDQLAAIVPSLLTGELMQAIRDDLAAA
jgi:hypothetical protein